MIFDQMKPERIVDELEKGLGDGDLTLIIACTKCDAEFQISSDAAALAIMTNCSFIEFLRAVQSDKCRVCNKANPDQ